MRLEFGTTEELTNTQYGPVAGLMVYYEREKVLEALQRVTIGSQKGGIKLGEKMEQVVWSIVTGCKTISEVNTKLRPERQLAQVKRIEQFAEQSTLSIALNELTQMKVGEIEGAVREISQRSSRMRGHDWRGFLTLDFDLSGLPCGQQAEGSKRGYFSGKKT